MKLPLVVGLGSHHGDDQAGWLVIEMLKGRGYPDPKLAILRHPIDLLDIVDTDRPLIICDAAMADEHTEPVCRFCWPTEQLMYRPPGGSHDLSLIDVLKLGTRLNQLPESIEIWTLSGHSWLPGTEPSERIRAAAFQVADAIFQLSRHENSPTSPAEVVHGPMP